MAGAAARREAAHWELQLGKRFGCICSAMPIPLLASQSQTALRSSSSSHWQGCLPHLLARVLVCQRLAQLPDLVLCQPHRLVRLGAKGARRRRGGGPRIPWCGAVRRLSGRRPKAAGRFVARPQGHMILCTRATFNISEKAARQGCQPIEPRAHLLVRRLLGIHLGAQRVGALAEGRQERCLCTAGQQRSELYMRHDKRKRTLSLHSSTPPNGAGPSQLGAPLLTLPSTACLSAACSRCSSSSSCGVARIGERRMGHPHPLLL